jgi:hypothetical protein
MGVLGGQAVFAKKNCSKNVMMMMMMMVCVSGWVVDGGCKVQIAVTRR